MSFVQSFSPRNMGQSFIFFEGNKRRFKCHIIPFTRLESEAALQSQAAPITSSPAPSKPHNLMPRHVSIINDVLLMPFFYHKKPANGKIKLVDRSHPRLYPSLKHPTSSRKLPVKPVKPRQPSQGRDPGLSARCRFNPSTLRRPGKHGECVRQTCATPQKAYALAYSYHRKSREQAAIFKCCRRRGNEHFELKPGSQQPLFNPRTIETTRYPILSSCEV
ncbi:hypothetical protein QBC32DRAFT_18895 [Pseudoneurospora amorphoporcata]|uniref:Uncharacterized protein n=1 Tax=Pseudoneurospora amorphoporcata TaxID=241081 RepID=A0AAN6SE47_9PEZI|nr:hypothetical protein QBC32DRAFT_18895 [Pseudoneurospora amorphoporcata]